MIIEISENVRREKELYVGIADMTIVAINPDQEECSKYGIPLINTEKTYLTTSYEGIKRLQLSFYLETKKKDGTKIKAVLNLFLKSNSLKRASDGLNALIDSKGSIFYEDFNHVQRSYIESPEYFRYDKYNDSFLRKAIVGEQELISLIRNITNAQDKDKTCLEAQDLHEIFNGNINQLKELIDRYKENKIRVLLGVQTDEFGDFKQIVYNKYFARPFGDSKSYFQDSLEKNKEWIKEQNHNFFNNDLNDPDFLVLSEIKRKN